MTDALRESLKAHAGELSRTVLDRMYENPFWTERYGARGRRFADEDSLFHLQYLDQALAAGDAGVFERYAVWLRSILVSRGMCSEHLAENFRLLADEIDARKLPSPHEARAVLDAGVRALVYREGEAAQLETQRGELVTAVESAPDAAAMREDDRRYLVSYLIDSIAANDPMLFESFATRCAPSAVNALREAAKTRSRPGS